MMSEGETAKQTLNDFNDQKEINVNKNLNQVKFSKVMDTGEAQPLSPSQSNLVTVPATHTSFRFNASHELLQYNQD